MRLPNAENAVVDDSKKPIAAMNLMMDQSLEAIEICPELVTPWEERGEMFLEPR